MNHRVHHSLTMMVALAMSASPTLADSLSSVGINLGMNYNKGKTTLTNNGWRVLEEQDQYAIKPFKQFPEITCGSGYDAICSVGFERDGASFALTVKKQDGIVVITGEY